VSGSLLDVLLPLFGLMGLGFGAVRLGVVDDRGVKGLVLFVFNFSIPSLLLRSMATMEFPDDMRWGFLGAFYAGSFLTYGTGLVVARFVYRRPLADQAIFAMGGGFANIVLMGIPITLTALGPDAALPMFLIIGVHSATFMPITVALIQAGAAGERTRASRVTAVFADVVRNPIILGILAGAVINFVGTDVWGPVDGMLELLGAAALPCALFAMGASLASYPLAGDIRPALVLTALKLIVHPLLVWVVAAPLLGLEGLWVSVPVLMAAMPSAVNVYLFGARYDAAPGVAARTVLLTSVGSMVTLSVVLALLQG
jgi:predicted permease